MQGLYAIIDPEHCRGRDPLWVAERVLEGGCAVLQLRAKRLRGAPLLQLADALAARCRSAGVPFWINDHLELALRVHADGLHLGQDDPPIEAARRLWGDRPIGLSTHSLDQVRQGLDSGADLLGFGPVFATLSKANPDPLVGVHGLRAAVCESHRPVIAIGGITLERAREVRDSGAAFAAAIGAVCGSEDPEAAARELHSALLSKGDST